LQQAAGDVCHLETEEITNWQETRIHLQELQEQVKGIVERKRTMKPPEKTFSE
jgi:hypothetical protein